MRLQISHETTFTFETPVYYVVQTLRLMPRGSSQQFINDWRIDVSADCRLSPVEDAFGNWSHTFSIDGPIEGLVITASGEVITEETNGIIRGTPERLPISVFMRDTDATRETQAVRDAAFAFQESNGAEPLPTLHALMAWIAETIAPADDTTETPANPGKIIETMRGSARDRSHLFISMARSLQLPARCVTGYVLNPDKAETDNAGHCWAEAYLGPHLGWVGFDPTFDMCPTESYVRTATGLDWLDAAPIRATSFGCMRETRSARVRIRETPSRRSKFA